MTIRPATAADLPRLRALYAASARAAGPGAYSEAQIEAWARFASAPAFDAFVLGITTLVAERENERGGEMLGFGGLEARGGALGRIASLYVNAGAQRQGVGTALLVALLQEARQRDITRLTTEASVFSRPLFARHGFVLEEIETVERGSVTFRRYLMTRDETQSPADLDAL